MTKKAQLRKRHTSRQGEEKNDQHVRHLPNPRPGKGRAHSQNQGSKQKKDPFMYGVAVAVIVVIATLLTVYWYNARLKQRVRTPLDVPPVIAPNATSAAVDPSRFWGTYRSHVYFGLKVRTPRSPVVGLMWMTQFTGEMPPSVRHWCDLGDQLPMYSWFIHDGRNFGIQEILDKFYTVSTDFIKRPGGRHGGDWSARISVKPRPGAENAVVSLFFYVALDGQGRLEAQVTKNRLSTVFGNSEELGDFKISFPKPEKHLNKSNHLITYAPSLDQLKEVMMRGFRLTPISKDKNALYLALGGRAMPQQPEGVQPNFLVHQVTVNLPFSMEVVYESGSFDERPNTLSGQIYEAEIRKHLAGFDTKFESKFGLQKKGYSEEYIGFAKAALSNMLGSIGYFHGSSLVKSKQKAEEEPMQYWPASLYSAVPSRPFFPRGFLWDEGFHNMLISKWDQEISKDIIGHWLDLINIEGWIPREQILGAEARAKVPEEFVVQSNENANPPTLFLPLQSIVKNMAQSDDPKDKAYLKHLFPRLKVWLNWFNSSQFGPLPSSYRWRGRDGTNNKQLNPLTLSSGLDDYPRASHPTDLERHLDLRCWIALACNVMAEIAKSLNEPWEIYQATYESLTHNKILDDLHWSEKGQRYSDYGLHTNSVKLERPKIQKNHGQRPPQQRDKERVIKKVPQYQYVDSFGYVSLFPFLLKFIDPQSVKLGKVLQDLQDSTLLWTKFGLRSLAKSDPMYQRRNTEHDPPYWRGNIWININYLAVRALHHYANTEGPYKDTAQSLYKELRENIINNIYKQFRTTGYIWENYNDMTGAGERAHPFTGWSALVVAMMAEEY